MAVDLTMVPWNRLAKLAPPGTSTQDLQEAADRWALRADLFNAAADLWEEAALAIDTAMDTGTDTSAVRSVTQDGISVTYAYDPLAGNGLSARIGSRAKMLAMAKHLRLRGKPQSVLMHSPKYDAWVGRNVDDDCQIILVDDV